MRWSAYRSVKRLCLWNFDVGCVPSRGALPSRIAGTENAVFSCAVVAFQYQVDSPASAAMFGKRVWSIWPLASCSSVDSKASKTTRTTGVSRAA
jgi:hypothetical protein